MGETRAQESPRAPVLKWWQIRCPQSLPTCPSGQATGPWNQRGLALLAESADQHLRRTNWVLGPDLVLCLHAGTFRRCLFQLFCRPREVK